MPQNTTTYGPTTFEIDITADLMHAPIILVSRQEDGSWKLFEQGFTGRQIGSLTLTADGTAWLAQPNTDKLGEYFAICQFRDAVKHIWQTMEHRPAPTNLR